MEPESHLDLAVCPAQPLQLPPSFFSVTTTLQFTTTVTLDRAFGSTTIARPECAAEHLLVSRLFFESRSRSRSPYLACLALQAARQPFVPLGQRGYRSSLIK